LPYISTLNLTNFRCYEQARLEGINSGLLVLHGPNGAGKTNVLEAVSLLAPGRGLRGAKTMEILRQGSGALWAVAASIQTSYGEVKLGTGIDPQNNAKRTIRVQGESAKSQAALGEHMACVWLTPQMDRLFLDGAGQRRRFLDRLVFTFDPGHSGRLTRYENALRQRSKLLQEGKGNPAWLEGLEAQIAETGIAVAAARLDFVERLQAACNNAAEEPFPKAELSASGTLEELLGQSPALEVEDLFRHQLLQSRGVDMQTGGAATGPHKSDLLVHYAAKDMPADQCSTGEQKALLIGIILAHARLIAAERGAPPVLLLDEVAAHLDEDRRAALFSLLQDMGAQVWLTGTDKTLFTAIDASAQFFEVKDAQIHLKA